jgi:hypothetical protein
MSVRLSEWNNSSPTGQRLMKFDILVFFENMRRKFKFRENLARITSTSHEDLCTFKIMSL